jgi:outer membrane lipoprotein-sorting protein
VVKQALIDRRRVLALTVLVPLAACESTPPAPTLGGEDAATLARVQAYLNSLRTLQARFEQLWPNGTVNVGTLWMQRPGHLRLQYAPPSPLTLIAADGTVLLYNAATEATTTMPLSRSPLGILLSDEIILSGPVTVTSVRRVPGQLQVSMVRTAAPAQGSLTLLFTEPPLTLHSLRIVDAHGQPTDFTLFQLHVGVSMDPSVFRL